MNIDYSQLIPNNVDLTSDRTLQRALELQGPNVQLRFDVPENSARLLLQRLAKVTPPPAVAAE